MKRHLIVLVVCVIGWGNTTWAAEKITWLVVNYPPAYILSGPQKGTGFCDVGGAILRRQLSAYEHEVLEVNLPRMMWFLQRSEGVFCCPGLGVAVGQFPDFLLSPVASIVPPAGIAIRQADREQFINAPNQSVSLEKLFQTPALTAGILEGTTPGKQARALVEKYKGHPNLYLRTTLNQTEYYQMLIARRVDYVLDYAFSFFSLRQQFSAEEQAQLGFLPVVEEPEPSPSYALCNNTTASRVVMDKISAIFQTEEYKTAVAQSLASFLPENLREEYYKFNLEMIGK